MGGNSGGGGRSGRSGSGGSSEQIYDSATPSEKDALKAYTEGSNSINQSLFGSKEASPETTERIRNLDTLLSKTSVTGKTELYRGVEEHHFDRMASELKPGDKFEYKGFMSSSRDQKVARSFADYKGDKDLMAKVTLKKGAKAMTIPAKAGNYTDKRESGNEVLIGRGQKFVYKGMTETHNAKILNFEYSG